MSKEIKHKMVPKLRFPEFEENWDVDILSNFLKIPATYGIVKAGDFQTTGFNMLRGGDIKDGKVNEDLPKVSSEIHNQYKRTHLKDGDVVIALVGYPGEAAVIPSSLAGSNISRAVGLIRVRKYMNSDYLVTYLNSPGGRKEVLKPSAGSAQLVVNLSALNKLSIPIPSPEEQQKIASCLSSLDDLITAENQKLEALKAHKKGLMQQLFPAEGKKVPELRFEEFKESGEWGEKGIGKMFKFKQGVQVPVENQHLAKDKAMVRFIRIIDITTNAEPPRYIENPGNEHLIQKDDLFMIRYGTPGLISVGYEGVIANNLFRLIWNFEGEFVSKFWFYSFQKLEKTIYNLSGSSSMPAISFSTLEDLNIRFPKKPEEQKRIANCLSYLDELIATQTEKIEALKEHKKGLMQGLFPGLNEINK